MEFVSEGSYKITGTLASLGDREIIEHGICWSESEKPDMECSLMELGPPSSAGEFSTLCKRRMKGCAPLEIVEFFQEFDCPRVVEQFICPFSVFRILPFSDGVAVHLFQACEVSGIFPHSGMFVEI